MLTRCEQRVIVGRDPISATLKNVAELIRNEIQDATHGSRLRVVNQEPIRTQSGNELGDVSSGDARLDVEVLDDAVRHLCEREAAIERREDEAGGGVEVVNAAAGAIEENGLGPELPHPEAGSRTKASCRRLLSHSASQIACLTERTVSDRDPSVSMSRTGTPGLCHASACRWRETR
jgi:hypothetical protein